jgi:hypothetical protein
MIYIRQAARFMPGCISEAHAAFSAKNGNEELPSQQDRDNLSISMEKQRDHTDENEEPQ